MDVTIGGVKMSWAAAHNLAAVCERSHQADYVAMDVEEARRDPDGWRATIVRDSGEPEYAQGWVDYATAILAVVRP